MIEAKTKAIHHVIDLVAYDCVMLVIVRSGGAILLSEFGTRYVNFGDVVVLDANILCGTEPEGWLATTTLYLDRDFVVRQKFWQYAEAFAHRLDAKRFLDNYYTEPAQVIRLGEDHAGLLVPWLDELS